MNVNKDGEVINGKETYEQIATVLSQGKPVLIGWTDEDFTHFDFLFTYKAISSISQILNGVIVDTEFLSGSFQGGIRPNDLFVSIMRFGCFGFEVTDRKTDAGYYEEKLGQRGNFGTPLDEKVADLINGVKFALFAIEKEKKE